MRLPAGDGGFTATMAARPEHSDSDHPDDQDPMSESHEYNDDKLYDPGAEGSSYQEMSSVHRIPTKSGGEDEMQLDSDRPGSAGTGDSTQLGEEDKEILTNTSVTSSQTLDFDRRIAKIQVLSRPDQPSDSSALSTFIFGPTSKQSLYFQGTRTLPTASMGPGHQSAAQPENGTEDTDPNTAAFVHLVQAAPETQPTEDSQPDAASNRTQQMSTQHSYRSGSKRSKAKKQKRHRSMLARQPGEATFVALASTSKEAEAANEKVPQLDPSGERFEDAAEDLSPALGEQARPMTPLYQSQAQDDQQAQASCPHSQLQGDLETNVQQSGYTQPTFQPEVDHANDELAEERRLSPMAPSRGAQVFQGDEAGPKVAHTQGHVPAPARAIKVKKSSKSSRKASTPVRVVSDTAAVSDSDINDYMQILMFKIREQCQNTVDNITAERDAIRQDLQQRLETMQSLQTELYQAQQDKDDLSAACDKQKAQLATYEAKVKRFKTFVEGLGRDVDSLKRDANATRRKSEELILEGDDRKAEREKLLEQMNSCTERSSQLKTEALKACSETQSELKAATLRAGYLDQQLGEKVGLLAEERDRRAQLERRLLSASEPSDSVLRVIKTNQDAVLDKLHLMHATLESTDADNRISDMLKEALEAVQAVASQTTADVNYAAVTKGLVEALNDRLSDIENQASTEPLKKQLQDVLTGLKGVADHQEDRVRQDAAHREATNAMQEKIKGSNVRVVNVEEQLQLAQTRERKLEEENKQLQSRITAIHSQPISAGDVQAHLNEARNELQAKVKALETANLTLTSKTGELNALKKTSKELETTMQSLREKIQELEQTTDDLVPAKEADDERIRLAVERVRTESLKYSQDYRAQLDMEVKNQLRKLTSDRDRYEKQVIPLKAELADSKKREEELQKKITESTATSEQLEQMKKLDLSQTREIEDLKSSLRDLQHSADIDASLKEKLASLSTDLDTVKGKLQQAVEENATLNKKADGYLHDSNEANTTCEHVRAELETYRADTETHVEKLNETLKDAQEARRRVEAGQEHFQKSCDAAIEDEAAMGRRKVEDLQTSLAQADAELRREKTDAEAFRAEMEKQWQLETTDHAQKLDDLRGQIEKAKAAKDEALTNNERSIEECRTLLDPVTVQKQHLASTEEKLNKHQETDTSSRLTVPSLSEGLTPLATVKFTEPTRPRKKVDRNFNSTLDASVLPAPEVLQHGSSRGKPTAPEAVIEGSQAAETQLTVANALEAGNGSRNFDMFSDDNDTTRVAQSLRSQPATQMVEETQIDGLPSFAAFNRTFSTIQAPELNRVSSSLSMTCGNSHKSALDSSHRVEQGLSGSSVAQRGPDYAAHQPDASFSIQEDSQEIVNQAPDGPHRTPTMDPRDIIDWSQEERDKYTFRKSMPQPNSASKLVRDDSQSSLGGKRRTSGLQERVPLRERRLHTPEVRDDAAHSSQRSMGHSSSPAYVHPAASRPARTYSNTPGRSAKRQLSRTQNMSSHDPRLVGRNPPPAPKRKAEDHVVEGYEQERKKRLSVVAVPSSDTSCFSLRSQQSIHDLPSFPTMPANPKGSSSQSRLRTLGGGSSRAPGSKKLSKADEYSARFSQELDRR